MDMFKNEICENCVNESFTNCEANDEHITLDEITRNVVECDLYKEKKSKVNSLPVHKIIIDYLNKRAGKNFRHTTSETVKFINGRISEGYTIEDFKKVIDIKVEEWKGDPFGDKYLTPSTLFRPSNFEKYLNQQRIKPKNKLQSSPSYDLEEIERRAMLNTEI